MVKISVDIILTEKEKRIIQEDWEKRHEILRKQLTVEESKTLRVMERYYGISSNPYKPILLEKITLDRIIKKHGDNGYIVISAYRSDKEQEVNDKATRSLISDLMQSGYSYLPVYGGNRDTKTGVEDSFEPSFLVFNYSMNGDEQPFRLLKRLVISWCRKYDQASVLIKAPSHPPVWLDVQGKVVNNRFTLDIEEIYVNPIPCTLNEERARKGEIMLWR